MLDEERPHRGQNGVRAMFHRGVDFIVDVVGGQQILIEVGSDTPVARDERITVTIEPESLYLFDPETEKAL